MKDKLIELLTNTPPTRLKAVGRMVGKTYTTASRVADHLLANGVIVPPCKVDGTVYYLTTEDTATELNVTDIFCGTVQGVGFDGTNIWVSAKYTNGLFYYHKSTDFGKTVFLSREEAEKALAKMKGGVE